VACAAVISLTIYRQSDNTQLAVQASPVPSAPASTEKQLDFAPPVLTPTLYLQPTLRPGSRNLPVLPVDSLRSDQFVPLKLEPSFAWSDLPLWHFYSGRLLESTPARCTPAVHTSQYARAADEQRVAGAD